MTYFEKKMEENENGTEQEHCRFFYKKLTKIEWLLLYTETCQVLLMFRLDFDQVLVGIFDPF